MFVTPENRQQAAATVFAGELGPVHMRGNNAAWYLPVGPSFANVGSRAPDPCTENLEISELNSCIESAKTNGYVSRQVLGDLRSWDRTFPQKR